jgi:hypothetical protein
VLEWAVGTVGLLRRKSGHWRVDLEPRESELKTMAVTMDASTSTWTEGPVGI